MSYIANPSRYENMPYRHCGQSGLKLPPISLGLWQNFGSGAKHENCKEMLLYAFDNGITHFDLANNYGPPAGTAEESFGKIINAQLAPHRDEIIVSTKAGYTMWPGPYGDFGSRKSLMASLEQSLRRMNLDYVDIFYHHRPDADTPLEESMGALKDIVKSGKALYVGISNYNLPQSKAAIKMLSDMGVRCLIHQMRYSMLARDNEALIDELNNIGVGSIAFSPLAQGLLTGKYSREIPADSRALSGSISLTKEKLNLAQIEKVQKLAPFAKQRGQSLAQLALAWVLRSGKATSLVLGASSKVQLAENLAALNNLGFSADELAAIDKILVEH